MPVKELTHGLKMQLLHHLKKLETYIEKKTKKRKKEKRRVCRRKTAPG
jgi:hypothetical protein